MQRVADQSQLTIVIAQRGAHGIEFANLGRSFACRNRSTGSTKMLYTLLIKSLAAEARVRFPALRVGASLLSPCTVLLHPPSPHTHLTALHRADPAGAGLQLFRVCTPHKEHESPTRGTVSQTELMEMEVATKCLRPVSLTFAAPKYGFAFVGATNVLVELAKSGELALSVLRAFAVVAQRN